MPTYVDGPFDAISPLPVPAVPVGWWLSPPNNGTYTLKEGGPGGTVRGTFTIEAAAELYGVTLTTRRPDGTAFQFLVLVSRLRLASQNLRFVPFFHPLNDKHDFCQGASFESTTSEGTPYIRRSPAGSNDAQLVLLYLRERTTTGGQERLWTTHHRIYHCDSGRVKCLSDGPCLDELAVARHAEVRKDGSCAIRIFLTTNEGAGRPWAGDRELASCRCIDGMSQIAPTNLQQFTGKLAAGLNKSGELEVFARGTDNALYRNRQRGAGGSWRDWTLMERGTYPDPFAVGGDPAVANNSDSDQRLEVFARGIRGELLHAYQLRASEGGGWSGLMGLYPHIDSDPTVVLDDEGRLNVFVRVGSELWHLFQDQPATGPWGRWVLLPSSPNTQGWRGVVERWFAVRPIGQTECVKNDDGRIEVFARAFDWWRRIIAQFPFVAPPAVVCHRWQWSTGISAGWSGWEAWREARGSADPVAALNAAGQVEVFWRGEDGAVYARVQTPSPAPGPWSAPKRLGEQRLIQIQGRPCVGQNLDGRLELFARGADNQLWHIWQGNDYAWAADWAAFGDTDIRSEPAVGRNEDGRLEVFALGPDGLVRHIWQQWPSDGWFPIAE